MTSARMLRRLDCLDCGEQTIHDEIGCIHRKTCGAKHKPAKAAVPRAPKFNPVLLPQTGIESLTEMEHNVLALIGSGCATGKIAQRLDMSDEAVRKHREQICRKIGIPLEAGTDNLAYFARLKHVSLRENKSE